MLFNVFLIAVREWWADCLKVPLPWGQSATFTMQKWHFQTIKVALLAHGSVSSFTSSIYILMLRGGEETTFTGSVNEMTVPVPSRE